MRIKPYPRWTCEECGKKHGTEVPKVERELFGRCDVCKKNGFVRDPEDFGNFVNWFDKQKK